jgi:hypothetical protein
MKYLISENKFKDTIQNQFNLELNRLKGTLEELEEGYYDDYSDYEYSFLRAISYTDKIVIDQILKDDNEWTIYINLYSYVGDFDYDLLTDYFVDFFTPFIGESIISVNKVIKSDKDFDNTFF